ncbi:collagen alpha-1(III) chain-like [Panthera pardus]|uniref:Collagen alpha-1(III) chain-like n=1 Tax=Panthera pardus TaxID=9691 RepID=A0A9W2W3N4_PANPR|nr:collagen alpha-1(III) chain-like [Panthera pardus]
MPRASRGPARPKGSEGPRWQGEAWAARGGVAGGLVRTPPRPPSSSSSSSSSWRRRGPRQASHLWPGVLAPPGSDRLRAWPAPPGPSASIPPTRLRLGPEAPASARPAARGPHAVHPARWQHPQNAARRSPSHPHAGRLGPRAQRPAAGTPSPTASARRAWPGGPRRGAKGRPAALAGNRTRVNCLEGSYAHHYTTNAARPGPARRGRPRVRSGAFSPWRSLAAAAAARRSPAPTSRPAAALPGHHGPPATTGSGHPEPQPRPSDSAAPAGRRARPPAHLPALRPAPGARRPPPPASGGRSGRLAALGPSEAGWGAPPRPRPGVFRVLRGPQLAARPGPAPRGKEQRGRPPGLTHHLPHPHGTGPICLPPDPHPRRLRGCAAARLGGTSPRSSLWLPRGPHEAPAARWRPSVRPRATQRAGARWTVGRPGTRRRPDDGRPRRSAPAPPSGARGGTQSCAGHQKGHLASPSGNRTPVSRVTGGDTHHYTNEDGGGRTPGRPPDPSPAASPRLPLPALDALPCTGARPGPRPTRPHPRFGPLSRTAAPGPDSESTRTRAHTRTRTALSTPNERCLSLVCQAGIAPGEKAPDGKRGCEGQGEGEGEDRPPPAPTEQTLMLTLTLTTGGDRQRRRPAPLGKPSVDHVRSPTDSRWHRHPHPQDPSVPNVRVAQALDSLRPDSPPPLPCRRGFLFHR